jgi:hypothetical protein
MCVSRMLVQAAVTHGVVFTPAHMMPPSHSDQHGDIGVETVKHGLLWCALPAWSALLLVCQVALGPTLDTVHLLCAAFGEVAKIAMFEKASGLQALVQFKDSRHAREAQQV